MLLAREAVSTAKFNNWQANPHSLSEEGKKIAGVIALIPSSSQFETMLQSDSMHLSIAIVVVPNEFEILPESQTLA